MMRFAYADPPYIGKAKKHYGDHPDYAGEVDHAELVERLSAEYPDGWALSCSSPSLRQLLALCPPDVRVLAWYKPFVPYKKGVGLAHTWEPVILRGGRSRSREDGTVRDSLYAPITMKRGLVGAKSAEFCYWLFNVLGAQSEDTLDDLFPGTGGVSAAWQEWQEAGRPLLAERQPGKPRRAPSAPRRAPGMS